MLEFSTVLPALSPYLKSEAYKVLKFRHSMFVYHAHAQNIQYAGHLIYRVQINEIKILHQKSQHTM